MKELLRQKVKLLNDYFTTNVFLLGVVFITAWPLLLWTVPYFSKWNWPVLGGSYSGYVISFIFFVVVLLYVVKRIRILIYGMMALMAFGLGVSTLYGQYSYKDLVKDYFGLVSDLQNQSQLVSVMSSDHEPFINAIKLQELISEKSAVTRKFAVKAATKHFQDKIESPSDRKMIQYLSVFKEINSKWVYVADPEGEEYFASPHETIEQLSIDGKFNGDCDDHAILMAASLKFVGATVRLVRTPTHVYPELKISGEEALNKMVNFIRREAFKQEAFTNSIFYHTDPEGNIWMNFDYTNNYPGGRFLDDNIVGILEF